MPFVDFLDPGSDPGEIIQEHVTQIFDWPEQTVQRRLPSVRRVVFKVDRPFLLAGGMGVHDVLHE